MKRSGTPTIELALPFLYGENVARFFADFSQGGKVVVEKTEADVGNSVDVDGSVMEIHLTQQETLKFAKGKVEFQLKVLTANGKVVISEIETFMADEVLNEEIFE